MKWTEAFKFVFAMVASVGGASAIILILSSWLGKVWAERILAESGPNCTASPNSILGN